MGKAGIADDFVEQLDLNSGEISVVDSLIWPLTVCRPGSNCEPKGQVPSGKGNALAWILCRNEMLDSDLLVE